MISKGMLSQPRPTHHRRVVDCAADMFEFLPMLLHHVDYQEDQQNNRLYHSLVLRQAM
jgi:hypothetical protein